VIDPVLDREVLFRRAADPRRVLGAFLAADRMGDDGAVELG
jgi:hypothetical protein